MTTLAKRVRTFSALLMLGALISLVVGSMGCTKTTEDKTTIGVILSISGRTDFIGKPEKRVLEELAASRREGPGTIPHFELDIRDSEGKPEVAKNLFTAFANNPDVIAIVGPSTSGESIAIAEEADRIGIPILSLAASKKIVQSNDGTTRKWTFKFAQNDDLAAHLLLSTIMSKGLKRVALLYSNDGFGKSGAEVFKLMVKQTTLQFKHESMFQASMDTPEPIVSGLSRDIDAIVIWGTAPGPQLLVSTIRKRGIQAQIFLSHGNASDEFIKSVGLAGEGVILVGSRVLTEDKYLDKEIESDLVILQFREFWRKRFGANPSHFGGHARDAFEMLLNALRDSSVRQAESNMKRNAIRNYLETKVTQFSGVTGTFSFSKTDHAGLDSRSFEIYQIRNNAFVPLDKVR